VDIAKEELPHIIVGACMEVHQCLGPGLHADAYRKCLAHELRLREIIFECDAPLTFDFKGRSIQCAATLDFIVESSMLLKVVATDEFHPKHKADLNNYLRLTGLESGFLINFNVEKLRDGIKRLIVSDIEPPVPYK
jgi:GxxExxY protein